MQKKNIFKVLAAAMLMPAMLLTTACSSEDDLVNNTAENTEAVANKGYALPVTVNVTRGDGATRATYTDNNDGTGSLAFSDGDKLFVEGPNNGGAGQFAGTLTWQSGGTFSGTIYTQNPYSGTADELFSAAAATSIATLLPNGYQSTGFLSIDNNNSPAIAYDDEASAYFNGAFVASETAKATGVEQLSFEQASTYSSGFALTPRCAILNFTISGLEAGEKAVSLLIHRGTSEYTVTGSVTPNASGVATFAIGVPVGANIKEMSNNLTVGSSNFTLPSSTTFAAGKIYNITRNAIPEVAASDLSMLDCAGNTRASSWTANCYMVHTAGNYKLPLVYGNAIKNGATNAAAYTGVSGQLETFLRHDGSAITGPWIKDNGITVTSAELLWQDAEGLITNVGIDGDYLTLTVGKNAAAQEGNAVVAAKDAGGNIVWSWHIWVTKQTFANLTSVNTGSHTYQVTPVNLGWVGDAVSPGYNTFYQWGRKDPFPGTGSVTYSTSSATIADNIKNPTTFYNVSEKPNTSTAYNLWDAQQTGSDNITTATKKTVYDPSPAGFCVPTGNLYYYFGDGEKNRSISTWDSTNNGATWNLGITGNALFFPASGRRDPGNGNLNWVGSYGYIWSASAYGSNANYAPNLIYSSDTAKWVWYYSRRSYGFPVRAVAEE